MKMPRLTMGRFLLACVGAAALYIAWGQFAPPQVSVQKPQIGKAIDAVYATGNVEAVDSTRIGAVAPGRVMEVLVNIGSQVKAGEVLAKLDADQSRHKLDETKARFALAQEELTRTQQLKEQGFATTQALQRAQAEFDQAKAALDVARKTLNDTVITAPFNGYIIKRLVDPGQAVAANADMFTMASTEKLRMSADVDERDIPRIKVGAEMIAKADAFPNKAFSSNVSTIRQLGDTNSRTFRVEAPLPPDTPLMAGMTIDVNVVLETRDDALLVPFASITHDRIKQRKDAVGNFVWVVRDGRANKVAVELGASGPLTVEIRSGISAEDEIVIDPPKSLRDGERVHVK